MWPFKKKKLSFEERQRKLESLLAKHSTKWTHINYGQYLYKRIIARAISHIMSIQESQATRFIETGKAQLNNQIISNPKTRLGVGKYILFVEGHGYYEFFIK